MCSLENVGLELVFIYPLQFNIEARGDVDFSEASGIPPRPRTSRITRARRLPSGRILRRRPWSVPERWFLSKLLENEFKLIEPSLIENELESLVLRKYEEIKGIDSAIFEIIERGIGLDIRAPSLYINKKVLAILGFDSGLLLIFSDSLGSIEPIVKKLKKFAEELTYITSDLGVALSGIYSGREYAINIMNSKADIIKIGEFKNEFEKKIYDQLNESITNAILSNFELKFEESSETYEYDNVLCIGTNHIYQISCKDYSSVSEEAKKDSTSLRNKVIFQPKDKAELINAKCYVVLRGFSEQLLKGYKAFGRPRGVVILDETEYLDELMKNILTSTWIGFI